MNDAELRVRGECQGDVDQSVIQHQAVPGPVALLHVGTVCAIDCGEQRILAPRGLEAAPRIRGAQPEGLRLLVAGRTARPLLPRL